MLGSYVWLFISEMELRILNIDCLLIQSKHYSWKEADITSNRHFIFLLGGHRETIQNGRMDPRYCVLISWFLIRGSYEQYYPLPGRP